MRRAPRTAFVQRSLAAKQHLVKRRHSGNRSIFPRGPAAGPISEFEEWHWYWHYQPGTVSFWLPLPKMWPVPW